MVDTLQPTVLALTGSQGKTGTDSLRDAINDLLSRKFNLGDAIERRELDYQAKPVVLRTGRSPWMADGDSEELIAMVNVAVFLRRGATLFRPSASYSDVAWVDSETFRVALEEDAPVDMGGGELHKYGGLCVCTTHVLLALDLEAVGKR